MAPHLLMQRLTIVICRRRAREVAAQLRALRGDIPLRPGAARPREETLSDQLRHSRAQENCLSLLVQEAKSFTKEADPDSGVEPRKVKMSHAGELKKCHVLREDFSVWIARGWSLISVVRIYRGLRENIMRIFVGNELQKYF
jgi:hypothetical protein